jgi:two-component system, NarL family, response regulator NreC
MVDLRVIPASSADDPEDGHLPRIRVVLADDHELMRRSLRHVLESEGIEVLGEAADHASTVHLVIALRPDVLVLDLSMPNGSGMETIRALHERAPDTGVVVVTMQHTPSFACAAFACGALGFVLKELADSDLGAAVRAAARGERYLSERVSEVWPGAA